MSVVLQEQPSVYAKRQALGGLILQSRDGLPLLVRSCWGKASLPFSHHRILQTHPLRGIRRTRPSGTIFPHYMDNFPYTRTYVRFPFHSPLILGGESYVCEGMLRNLSLHGCSIISDRELALGSRVRVSLLLPDQPRALPIEMGRVVWTQGSECGLEFKELLVSTRLRLGRILRVALIDYLNARKLREGEHAAV